MPAPEKFRIPIGEDLYAAIGPPLPGDSPDLLYAHQRAFINGYARTDGKYNATEATLTEFVYEEGFIERNGPPWEDIARNPPLGTYVARLDTPSGRAIGYGKAVKTEIPGTVYIGGMYVDPDFHKRGIGKALLRAVLDDFRDMERANLLAPLGGPAASFYKHLGFVLLGDIPPFVPSDPAKAGIDLWQVTMSLDLRGDEASKLLHRGKDGADSPIS